ncbi:hypothetical protein MM_0885 [Methanosarcina mazei Go1]|uniref:Uncharacterized protein n=1 Tax=Methanosarcina mazei (strain ATCC BAA-159 / DSM 3647 / Goe1 / Go1 / JCM 11833 / OCM 88) TaxID=192952 RepID=Q8PYH7_METMA|nr:hypothetical protein MM_0885 [Methanosarcina mazei Go1]
MSTNLENLLNKKQLWRTGLMSSVYYVNLLHGSNSSHNLYLIFVYNYAPYSLNNSLRSSLFFVNLQENFFIKFIIQEM